MNDDMTGNGDYGDAYRSRVGRPRLAQAALWLVRGGGWQRITWSKTLFADPPRPMWLRHRFAEWMDP